MKNALKKLITVFCLSISLSTTTPPQLAARTKDTIELVTALLRGYAAYSEYELRNDTSRSAHVKRALIHAVRLVNDLCACKVLPDTTIGNDPVFVYYDSFQIAENLYACLKNAQPNAVQTSSEPITDGHEHETFRRFVLPAIEALGALARTRLIASSIPGGYVGLLAEFTGMSRCLQRIYAAPKNSARRKIWGTLMVLQLLEVLLKIAMLSNPDINVAAFRRARQRLGVQEDVLPPQVQQAPQGGGPGLIRIYPEVKIECSICKDDNCVDRCVTPCGHIFGVRCLQRWLGANPICPNCRVAIPNAGLAH